jgi:hypothetical protein
MTSVRRRAKQNLQVAAVNEALDRNLFTLERGPVESATFEFTIGSHQAIASIRDGGHDEVQFTAVVDPTELGREFLGCPITHEHLRFGRATTGFWLERRIGKYIQACASYHGGNDINAALAAVCVEPKGFDAEPRRYSRAEIERAG